MPIHLVVLSTIVMFNKLTTSNDRPWFVSLQHVIDFENMMWECSQPLDLPLASTKKLLFDHTGQ